MIPRHAIINDQDATFLELVPHASGGEAAVICTIGEDRRYVTQDEWLAGASPSEGVVTAASSNAEKITLFRSYFVGRPDVYALGYPTKKGGIGYAPACQNDFKPGVCPRKSGRQQRCGTCANRSFGPLSDRTLIEHFLGKSDRWRDVVGLYVMQEGNVTSLLVADFDEAGWQREVLAYAFAGRDLGIDVAIERSRSGNGAHAWIFFCDPVPAEKARDLGSHLITRAMTEGRIDSFTAYDRFFPAQDSITEDGLGNLIALPFQGRAKQADNSVFVDDDLRAYPDQWRYLSSVKKLGSDTLDRILDKATHPPLGELAYSKAPTAEAQTKAVPDHASMPSSIRVVKKNMLYIDRSGIPTALQNRLRRLGAFANPEFYRAQAMHQSVYGKPRVIDQGRLDEETITLPRGCEKRLLKLAKELSIDLKIEDRRFSGTPIRADFTGTLRPTQQQAADALLRHECGILSAPTGFGKTVIGAYLIGTLKLRTLVIVPNTALLAQWQERLAAFLDIREELPELLTKTGRKSRRKRSLVGQIGSGKNLPSGIVDIATYQSLTEKGEIEGERAVRDIVGQYGLVICDECQHGAAPQLAQILAEVHARYVYGLSATPKRSDSLEGILYMQCGPIVHKVNPKEQAHEQGFSRLMRPKFTRVRMPRLEPGSSFNQILDALCKHEARNQMIVRDTVSALEEGRSPLVITGRKDHAASLAKAVEGAGFKTFLLTGEGTPRERKERLAAVAQTPLDQRFAIVATGSYLGEGFDEPRLDTLLLASPVSFEGLVTQYSGRLHRESEGKSRVVVIDYVDTSVPMLDRMYHRRLKAYAKLGYALEPSDGENGAIETILDGGTYAAALGADFATAGKSIFLAVPYVHAKRVCLVAPLVEEAVGRGIAIEIVVNRPKSPTALARAEKAVSRLIELGCHVELRERRQSSLAIFDEETVWYGSLPLLAFPEEDDCSLRFKNAEIAFDLLENER